MKLLSLMLLSLGSAVPEYECGSVLQPHFHHYPSRDFMGHFKIKNDEYRILKSGADTNKRREKCLQAKNAINRLAPNFSGMFILEICFI